MKYEILKFEVSDNIALVTNNRPQKMNALNSRFFLEMEQFITELKTRNDVRVMIITGEGKAFAAGADIAEMVDMTPQRAREFSDRGKAVFRSLELLEIPVIAAVNGFALGGGCELALACDIRIASTEAKFGQPEVSLGLIPGYAATQRLPRLMGLGNALYLMLSGEMITAEEALNAGLVQKILPPDQLMDNVMGLAKKIISKGSKAIQLVKKVTRQGSLMSFEKGCELETQHFGDPFGKEGAEGMKAFLEKRSPNW